MIKNPYIILLGSSSPIFLVFSAISRISMNKDFVMATTKAK